MASFTFLPAVGLAPLRGVAPAALPPAEEERLFYPQIDPLFLGSLSSYPSSSSSSSSAATFSIPSCSLYEPPMLVPSLAEDQEAGAPLSPSISFLSDDAELALSDDLLAGLALFAPPCHGPPLELKPESLVQDADTSRFLDDCLTEDLREPSPSPSSSSSLSLAPSPLLTSSLPSRAGSPLSSSSPSPSPSSSTAPLPGFEGQLPLLPSRKRTFTHHQGASIPVLPPRKRKVGEVMPEVERKERNKVAALKYRQRLRETAEETELACQRLLLENTELACQIKMERENIERLKQTLIKYGLIPASAL